MKKTMLLTLCILLIAGASAWAKTIDQEENVSIKGISTIIVEDTGIKSVGAVINNLRVTINVFPATRKDVLIQLKGEATSSNRKCLPALEVDRSGNTLSILLDRCKGLKFFIISRGEVTLDVYIPNSYDKNVNVRSSSGRVNIGSFILDDLNTRVSSGSLTIEDLTVESAEIRASSGDISISSCTAGKLLIKSSSGRIDADVLAADSGEVTASSGSIRVGKLEGDFYVHASSGKIRLDETDGRMEVDSSSGDVKIQKAAGHYEIDTSSGDVEVDFDGSNGHILVDTSSGHIVVEGLNGSADLEATSGRITAEFARMTDDSFFNASSGDITIILPEDQEFVLDAKTSSGRIDLDFPITVEGRLDKEDVSGTVGSGGSLLKVKTSSGDLELRSR